MQCPFLRQARVRDCRASAYRKMILETPSQAAGERCSSPTYTECPAAAPRLAPHSEASHCPFLQESGVEYCGAASMTRFIPATDALLSRCNSDAHLYCDLFLSRIDPARVLSQGMNSDDFDDVSVPTHLWYAPNHMWLDVADDGLCHVGIDGFLARVLGAVEKVGFVTSRAADRPVAVLTVNGVDLQMVFPNVMQRTLANVYLRDPYGSGWLFEGRELASDPIRGGLLTGAAAAEWMQQEVERVTTFVHALTARPGPDGISLMADGGRLAPGFAAHLGRGELIDLVNEFFAPHTGWRR